MSTIGSAIRSARRKQELSQGDLAELAQKIPGAPDISVLQVAALEHGRATIRLDDDGEPLPWVMRALGIPGGVVLKAIGLAAPTPPPTSPRP